jgi:hypothetical protein
MTKYTLTFLAGSLSVAIPVFFADSRLSLMFFFGITFTLAAGAAALGSASRTEAAGQFLIAVSQALRRGQEGRRTLRRVYPASPREQSPLERDVVSAVQNMGASRTAAAAAVRHAIDAAPQGDFDTLFRLAVSQQKKGAA